MGKTINAYMIFLTVSILLFHFAGLIDNTPISFLLNTVGITDPEGFSSSSFYSGLIAAMAIGVVGIAMGTLMTRSATMVERIQSYGFIIGFLIPIGWDLIALWQKTAETNVYVATLVFSGLILVYLLSCYEFWRARD